MEKIYAGSGKVVQTQYGALTKISFSKTDLEKLLELANGNNGWVNLVLKEKKQPVEGKPTHYLEVDTWKPTAKQGWSEKSETVKASEELSEMLDDKLPF